jgi:cytochrome c oxidase subunit 1/cytochrome c oxidase subunit I+III
MFATGLPGMSMSFFAAASFTIAIPSAVSVFAWIATIWYGRPVYRTPFLFVVGFIVLFVLGGLSGVMTAVIPFDWQLTDSYFVVAHLHYVLIGLNVFPAIGALYYWLPKITGRMLSERLGRWNFWTMFVGFNVAFFPMHTLGLLGMPRRIYTYASGLGWESQNLVVSIGAFLFAIGILLFLINFGWSLTRGPEAGPNPWSAGTLEWATTSPPPPHNFAVIPTVENRHPLWEDGRAETGANPSRQNTLQEVGHDVLGTSVLDARPEATHEMPHGSLWPLALSLCLIFLFAGLLAHRWSVAGIGGVLLFVSLVVWLWGEGGRRAAA